MAIQMTREEYQAKYGVAPVFNSGSSLDNEVPAPRRMTQAEYDAEYNPQVKKEPSFGGNLVRGAIKPFAKLGTSFVNTAQVATGNEMTNTFSGDYLGDVDRIGKDFDVTKGLTKENIKAMKDSVGVGAELASWIPIAKGAGLSLSAMNKAFKTGGLQSLRAIMSPVVKGLVVEGAVGGGLGSFGNALQEDKSVGQTIKDTALGVGIGVIAAPVLGMALPVLGGATKNLLNKSQRNALIKAEKDIFNIENKYSNLRKANEFKSDTASIESRQRIAQSGVLTDSVGTDGKLLTDTAIKNYRKMTVDGLEDVVKKNLDREAKTVNLKQVEGNLIRSVYNSSLEGADLISAVNKVKKEIAGLKVRADEFGNIPLTKIHEAKINTTSNINFNTAPEVKTYRKAVARSYKEFIEETSKTNVKEVNQELSKFYGDIERLKNLDGKPVNGGKLGKYFAQVSGNIVGAATGGAVGGPAGMAIGTIAGGEAAGFLKGKMMSKTFGTVKGGMPENKILAKALADSKMPKLMKPDIRVGVPKGILKTKEAMLLEKQIAKNVGDQAKAIKAGNFDLVATLKEIYTNLVIKLKELIKSAKESPKEAGFIDFSGGQSKSLGNRKIQYSKTPITNKTSIDKVSTKSEKVSSGKKTVNKIHPEDIKAMEDYIDNVRVGKDVSEKQLDGADKLAERFGISQDLSSNKIANEFEKVLNGQKKVKGTIPKALSKAEELADLATVKKLYRGTGGGQSGKASIYGDGVYFAESKDVASKYGNVTGSDVDVSKFFDGVGEMPVNIKNSFAKKLSTETGEKLEDVLDNIEIYEKLSGSHDYLSIVQNTKIGKGDVAFREARNAKIMNQVLRENGFDGVKAVELLNDKVTDNVIYNQFPKTTKVKSKTTPKAPKTTDIWNKANKQ